MSTTIWKFPLPLSAIDEPINLEMPVTARILTCQMQNGVPTIWAVCPETALREIRTFVVLFSGRNEATDIIGADTYIGTVQGMLVYHVFEKQR